MTRSLIFRAHRAPGRALLVCLVAGAALAAGCAAQDDSANDTAGSDESAPGDSSGGSGDGSGTDGGESSGPEDGAAPVVDAACPQQLTANQLGQAESYPAADVDGDGMDDAISIGSVTGAGGGCSAALVVTTANGAAVAALPGLDIVPPASFVPGAAGSIGGQTMVAAPVSFSPRGGGEVGLFTLVDGALVPVTTDNGDPWTILSTIDDGGGIPQSIDCEGDVLTHTTMTANALGGTVDRRVTRWSIDGASITKIGQRASTTDAGPNSVSGSWASGLSIFDSC